MNGELVLLEFSLQSVVVTGLESSLQSVVVTGLESSLQNVDVMHCTNDAGDHINVDADS